MVRVDLDSAVPSPQSMRIFPVHEPTTPIYTLFPPSPYPDVQTCHVVVNPLVRGAIGVKTGQVPHCGFMNAVDQVK